MDIFQLNQYSGASFIQILMIWMFHLLKTFEWDSIIKCYIKIHYLNALGTKLFFIAMPHCTYFVHNFKTFRRHFFACQIIFFTHKLFLGQWVQMCVSWLYWFLLYVSATWTKLLKITYSCCYIFFLYLMIILSWCKM